MTTSVPASAVHTSFGEWALAAKQNDLHPLIFVVGTRGKSTVARLLDSIAREAGLRTALRTDAGVEIEGKRQLGDIHPLTDALEELDAGQLDLVIVEMAWGDINTLPLGDRKPGAVVVTTICPHKDYCLLDETRRAISNLKHMLLATPPTTLIAADIDDSAFPSLNDIDLDNLILTTASEEHPTLRKFLAGGGIGAWSTDDTLMVGTRDQVMLEMPIADIPLTLEGHALFQMRNVMIAAAVALGIGFERETVRAGLNRVAPDNATMPTSLNWFMASDIRVVIDRPSPSWFLGPLLRATRSLKANRLIFVVDYRDVPNHDDSVEVGRMIGRNATMIVLIDDEASLASVVAIKAGIAQNDVPPPIAHAETLQKAVLRALAAAREDDVVVVLTSRTQSVYRALARFRGP